MSDGAKKPFEHSDFHCELHKEIFDEGLPLLHDCYRALIADPASVDWFTLRMRLQTLLADALDDEEFEAHRSARGRERWERKW